MLLMLMLASGLKGPALTTVAAQSTLAEQTELPDLATYERWLREAYSAAQRNDRLGLEAVAEQLLANSAVRLGDGTTAAVDNRWLTEALDSPTPELEPIALRLGALIDALTQPELQADPQAQQKLRDILARPPFAPPQEQDLTWLQRMFEALGNFLDWLLPTSGPVVRGGSAVLTWGLLLLGSLAVIALVGYAIYSLRRGIVGDASIAEDDPEAGLTASSALQQAGEIARAGDYRTAVRYLYLSSLLWLDERGLLRYDRALTNREYLLQVHTNQELHGRLAPVVETFDQVWYGHRNIDQPAFEAYRRQIDELRRSVGGR